MLRDVGIASILMAMIATGVCLVIGADGSTILKASTAAALLPACWGAIVQLKVIGSRMSTPGLPIVPPTSPWRRYAQAVAALPEPERIRLIPVRSNGFNAGRALDSQGASGEKLRLVPVRPITTIDQIDQRDIAAFVSRLEVLGHSRSRWIGQRLPSGRRINSQVHRELCDVLTRCGALSGRRQGTAGVLTMTAAEIAERLGLPGTLAQPACVD